MLKRLDALGVLFDEFGQGLLFLLVEDRKRQAKTNHLLRGHHFSPQRKPLIRRKLNLEANDFADINGTPSVDEAAIDAQVFNPTFMQACDAVPLGGEVNAHALV
jgi:hypothetical protein